MEGFEHIRPEVILKRIENYQVGEIRSKEEAWDLLYQKIHSGNTPVVKFRKQGYFTLKQMYYAAASIIIFFFLYFTANKLGTDTVTNPRGMSNDLRLPDQSFVALNAESQIQYSKLKWNFIKVVYLDGEAFFDVEKGDRFIVKSDKGKVKVLGTKFNVYDRDDQFDVKCYEGKVEVYNQHKNYVLTKGEGITFYDDKVEKYTINHTSPFWRNGEFYFNKSPLKKVFNEMERQFDVEILLEDNQTRTYSGYFNNMELEDALEMVCIPMNLRYELASDTIKIFPSR